MWGAAVVMPAAPCFFAKMQCLVRNWQYARSPKFRPAVKRARLIFNAITSRSGSGRPRRAVARVALEEQRLAGDRGNHRRLERLRDEERRFGALAGQEAFGIGGDKDHRDLEHSQQLG